MRLDALILLADVLQEAEQKLQAVARRTERQPPGGGAAEEPAAAALAATQRDLEQARSKIGNILAPFWLRGPLPAWQHRHYSNATQRAGEQTMVGQMTGATGMEGSFAWWVVPTEQASRLPGV